MGDMWVRHDRDARSVSLNMKALDAYDLATYLESLNDGISHLGPKLRSAADKALNIDGRRAAE